MMKLITCKIEEVLIYGLVWSRIFGIMNQRIFKVPSITSTIPNEIESCFIGEFRMKRETFFGCSALCQANSSCLFACQSGPRCRLYYANVAAQWDKTKSNNFNQILYGFTCHSFWAEAKDVAGNVNITTLPPYSNAYTQEKANEGFGCSAYNDGFYSHSTAATNPWFLADLGKDMWIDRVVIQTRGMAYPVNNYFNTVEVRIGNETKSGDFSTYELLMLYNKASALGEIVTFKREKPLQGRFVSVQVFKTQYIVIVEMKIITA